MGSFKDAITNINISVAEYKRFLKMEQRLEIIKSITEKNKFIDSNLLRTLLGVVDNVQKESE